MSTRNLTTSNSERVTNLIDPKGIELHFEKANIAAETVEKGKGLILIGVITAGTELNAAKAAIPHGEWMSWLKKNWNYSHSLANKYMRAANSERVTNLTEPVSMRQAFALSMLSNDLDEDSAVLSAPKTGQVTVVDPQESSSAVPEAPAVKHEADTPTAAPPTIARTSAETRRTPEARKPRTQPVAVTAELVEESAEIATVVRTDDRDGLLEACCRIVPATAILRYLINICPPGAAVKLGKQLREAADTVNPSTKFRPPDVEEVAAYCEERRTSGATTARVDPETFVAHYRARGWKLNDGNKMQDWRGAVITWEKREKNSNGRSNRNSTALTGADW